MYEKGRISVSQFFIWMVLYLTAASSSNNLDILFARQDAFLSNLLAIVPGIVTVFFMVKLQSKYPEQSLFSISERVLGRWPGKLITVFYIYFCLELCIYYARGFSEFVVTVMTPELSVDVYLVAIVLVGAYAVFLGIEPIARITQLLFPFYILLLLIVNLLLVGQFNLEHVRPFFDNPPGRLMFASWLQYVFPMGEAIFFAGVIPYVRHSKHMFRAAAGSVVLAGIFLAYRAVVTVGVLGLGTALASNYPYFNAIRLVKIGEFVERIDILFLGIFVMAVLIQFITIFYMLTHGVAHLFEVKKIKNFTLPLAFFIFAISNSAISNFLDIGHYLLWVRPITGPVYMLLLPALLLGISYMRNRKATHSGASPYIEK